MGYLALIASAGLGWVVLLETVVSAQSAEQRHARPNILFILADDIGPEWIGCYGSEHQTPHLDALAQTGIRFTTAWATPLCTPTRHELLTGRYPFRTGWTVHYDSPRWGGQYFDWRREITFARVLREAGYATAITGKWQMNDFRVQPDALKQHGFDEHCVWTGAEADNKPSEERYFDPFIQENGRRGTRAGRFGPDVFADYTIDFMKRHKDGPFLAYHAMVMTHTPFTKTPRSQNPARDGRGAGPGTGVPGSDQPLKGGALHPGMVDYMDEEVGRLLQALDDLKIREKTVVIFCGDNGTVAGVPCRMNGTLVNGGKGTPTERGVHVPLIVSWPSRAPRGLVSDVLVDFSDFFPTLVDLARTRSPDGVTIDGRSFAGTLSGKDVSKRDWIYSQLGMNRIVRNQRYKLWSNGKFFDLIADPQEQHDLANSDDPEVKSARATLAAVLAGFPADAKLPFPPAMTRPKGGKE